MSDKKPMILRAVFTAEVPDKSGEIVSVRGLNLDSIHEGKGLVNSEHSNSFAKTVGKILNAKKIFKESDCANDFEKRSFKKTNGVPIVVGTMELFPDHEEAEAIAKIVKYSKNKGEPLLLGTSVEGGILEREGPFIKQSIMRKVAITASSCNEAATMELASEMSKSEFATYQKMIQTDNGENILCKGSIEDAFEYDEDKINESIDAIKIRLGSLVKALEAGFGGASGTLTQGAALQKQNLKGVKPSEKITGEETTLPGEETTKEAAPEASGLKEIDEKKSEKVDNQKEDAKIKFKLKKAEFIAYSFYSSLKK